MSRPVPVGAAAARRIALGAQGFADPAPRGRVDRRHLRRVMRRMQVVQLDSVQYVARSHELPFFARLGPHDRTALQAFLWGSGETVETWSHEASVVLAELEPLHRWRQEAARDGAIWGSYFRVARDHPDYVAAVLDEVDQRGPLRAGDLSDPRRRQGEWWANRSQGKLALEYLFATGELAAARNERFERVYDLPERVVPDAVRLRPTPSRADAQRELLARAGDALGVATLTDLADYWRIKVPEARPLVAELVEEGRLVAAEVEGWDRAAFLAPDAARPRRIPAATVLSPFDPVVWFRDRAERLFSFRYRIEIYTPAAKREFGYYVLPFLVGDRLVGRVDVKADRAAGVLRTIATFLEDGVDHDEVVGALAGTLGRMREHLGMASVSVECTRPLGRALVAPVAARRTLSSGPLP